jgi:hypothetical protein
MIIMNDNDNDNLPAILCGHPLIYIFLPIEVSFKFCPSYACDGVANANCAAINNVRRP